MPTYNLMSIADAPLVLLPHPSDVRGGERTPPGRAVPGGAGGGRARAEPGKFGGAHSVCCVFHWRWC